MRRDRAKLRQPCGESADGGDACVPPSPVRVAAGRCHQRDVHGEQDDRDSAYDVHAEHRARQDRSSKIRPFQDAAEHPGMFARKTTRMTDGFVKIALQLASWGSAGLRSRYCIEGVRALWGEDRVRVTGACAECRQPGIWGTLFSVRVAVRRIDAERRPWAAFRKRAFKEQTC